MGYIARPWLTNSKSRKERHNQVDDCISKQHFHSTHVHLCCCRKAGKGLLFLPRSLGSIFKEFSFHIYSVKPVKAANAFITAVWVGLGCFVVVVYCSYCCLTYICVWTVCGGQRTRWGNWFSPSIKVSVNFKFLKTYFKKTYIVNKGLWLECLTEVQLPGRRLWGFPTVCELVTLSRAHCTHLPRYIRQSGLSSC